MSHRTGLFSALAWPLLIYLEETARGAGKEETQADRLEIQKRRAAAPAHAFEDQTRIRTIAPPQQANQQTNRTPRPGGVFFGHGFGCTMRRHALHPQTLRSRPRCRAPREENG